MKRLATVVRALALTLSGALAAQSASASMMVQPQVTGHVTALASNEVIVVDGHRYLVAANSAAYKIMSSLHVGDAVSLYLDGPVRNSASHVTAIQVTHAP
jgi:uncharacterized protein (AIM24 family)